MRATILTALLILASAPPAAAQDKAKPNPLTPKEIADGWILLFDGETTFGWSASGEALADGDLCIGGAKSASVITRTGFGSLTLRFEYHGSGKDFPMLQFESGSHGVGGFTLQTPKDSSAWNQAEFHYVFDPRTKEFESRGECMLSDGTKTSGHVKRIKVFEDTTGLARIRFHTFDGGKLSLRNLKLRPRDTRPLFNGKDLTGWHVSPGRKSQFTVEDGAIVCKNGPGDLQTEGKHADFVLQLECKSNGKHLNSGIFFRCKPNEYQNGYEAQIHNNFSADPPKDYTVEEYDAESHKLLEKRKVKSAAVDYGTGAIYRRVPARKETAKDGEWFTMTVVAHGNHIATWVNGIQQVDWYDHRPASDNPQNGCRLEAGHISIQGHDPTTDLSFRNIRIAELPAK
jgi:hypothetical protein